MWLYFVLKVDCLFFHRYSFEETNEDTNSSVDEEEQEILNLLRWTHFLPLIAQTNSHFTLMQ